MKSAKPTQTRRIYNAVKPEPALTRATDRARRVQPTGKKETELVIGDE